MATDNKRITTKEQWNNVYSALYEKLPITPTDKSWIGYQIYTELIKYFEKDSTKKFIEAGCAPGEYGIFFAKLFEHEIFGFDYSPEGLALTKSNWELSNIKGNIIEADIFDLPDYYQNNFDVVFSAGFIEHFRDPQEIIDIFHSLLKKDGLIVTIIPNTYSCLNMTLKKIFSTDNYLKIKDTHIPIDFETLLQYHCRFDILCAKRIVGFFPDSIFSSRNILSKMMSRILNKALIIPARLNRVLQYNYLSSNFMIIGKKAA